MPARSIERPRVLAYYLPQFHPIPENDAWWAKGFTEWTNAAKARQRFPGHYQPHLPADLGFYDLRVAETRVQQAELARLRHHRVLPLPLLVRGQTAARASIQRSGGERLAELPVLPLLGQPDVDRIWHGAPNRILIEQTYPGKEDHAAHFAALLPGFRDARYVRVDGKPLFLIFASEDLPYAVETLDYWRSLASHAGLAGLYVVATARSLDWDFRRNGFDAAILQRLPNRWFTWRHPVRKVARYVGQKPGVSAIYSYREVLPGLLPQSLPVDTAFPTTIPNWDNSPRSGANGLTLHGSTPALFARHMRQAIELVADFSPSKRLIFVKSWNEWAEGHHLEPERRFGHGYLQVVRDELERIAPAARDPTTAASAVSPL